MERTQIDLKIIAVEISLGGRAGEEIFRILAGGEPLDSAESPARQVRELLVRARFGKAEAYYKRTLSLTERRWAFGHPEKADKLNRLARFYLFRDRAGEALPLLQRAQAINKKCLGSDHLETVLIVESLATAYEETGDSQKAGQLLLRAKNALGPDLP